MSYANGTPFLNLAQTIGTDHRDWFDENAAKLDLDTKMKTLWDGAADTATILAALQESVGTLQTDVTTLEGVVSGHASTITTINESLVLINTALNALNTQVTNKFDSVGIADPYDASHGTYAVGDVVTYNGQRYICTTAVVAAEPFDVSKWTAKDIQAELDDLSSVDDILTGLPESGAHTVPSMSNYRYICVELRYSSNAEGQTTMIPMDVFKKGQRQTIAYSDLANNVIHYVNFIYLNDTSINIGYGLASSIYIGFVK